MQLTPRQARIALLIQRGWTDLEIARDLGVSVQRAGQLIAALAHKLGGTGKPRRIIREHLVNATSRGGV